MQTQFHKTKQEEWVVLGNESKVTLGMVTVTKKDGSTEEVEVMRVGKTFEKDGEQVRYGYIFDKNNGRTTTAKTRTPTANAYFAQLRKDEEAKKAGVKHGCDLCGEEAEMIGRDKNGKLGDLCAVCVEIDETERVFG